MLLPKPAALPPEEGEGGVVPIIPCAPELLVAVLPPAAADTALGTALPSIVTPSAAATATATAGVEISAAADAAVGTVEAAVGAVVAVVVVAVAVVPVAVVAAVSVLALLSVGVREEERGRRCRKQCTAFTTAWCCRMVPRS